MTHLDSGTETLEAICSVPFHLGVDLEWGSMPDISHWQVLCDLEQATSCFSWPQFSQLPNAEIEFII